MHSSNKMSQEFLQRLKMTDVENISEYVRNISTPVWISMGAVAAATTYYWLTRPKALLAACDLHQQSLEIPGGQLARRSVLIQGENYLTHIYDDATTMYEFFLRGARISNNGPCLGSRKPKQPYEWISYLEVKKRTENLGSAFLYKGHSKSKNKHIGIFSQNRPEWTMCELACYTYSLVVVPLYDTLGTEAIVYILDKGSISTIVCDVVAKVQLILDCVKDTKHSVKTIILMEIPSLKLVERGHEAGIEILSLKEMEVIGKLNYHQPIPPYPEDMAVICFTSGTTGNPKGAMLTHQNIVCECSAFIKIIEPHLAMSSDDVMLSFLPLAHMLERVVEISCKLGPTDVHISYLPLAHMFERIVQGFMLMHGGRIGFFQGDIRKLTDDLNTLRPTVFPVVPRLLNRMYDKIYGQANSFWERWLLNFAYKRKKAEMRKGIVRRDSIWDRLIFSKFQASLGGRVRLMMTGAAPISPTILTFIRAAVGCQVYEGYGQTECTAGCTVTMPGDWSAGHVGPPLPCNSVKLADVPEMNYFAVNGEGEVCVKGPNVFQGYLNDPEKTAEAIDADGWLHTGDIGKWLPNGTLKIVDRKKHIFKMAQGEYIAPEKIENIYVRSEAVAQLFVYGHSLQACLVAVVVPDPDFLSSWSKRKLKLHGTYQELCRRAEIKEAILEEMQQVGTQGGLKSFEQVKAIYLHTEMFSVENGLLTPTMKSKRNEMRQFFQSQIDELYSSIPK